MSNWQSNSLGVENEVLSSVTTLLETPDSPGSVFPPFDYNIRKIKSSRSGVSLDARLSRMSYSANDFVEGKLIIKSTKTNGIKFGKIEVRLVGFEGTLPYLIITNDIKDIHPGKKNSNRHAFLSKLYTIQNSKTPPCAAVYPGSPDENGTWRARTGSNTFDFSIPFIGSTDSVVSLIQNESILPSSYWRHKTGGIRYLIACIVHYKVGSSMRTPLAVYRNIEFTETNSSFLAPVFYTPVKSISSAYLDVPSGLFNFGKRGIIKLSMHPLSQKTESNAESNIWISGSTGFIHLTIDNGTQKELKEIHLSLSQRLKTFKEVDVGSSSPTMQPLDFTREVIVKKRFRVVKPISSSGKSIFKAPVFDNQDYISSDWIVAPGETRNLVLELDIPTNVKSIRYAKFLDVSFVVQATVFITGGNRINVEAPITILNHKSLVQSSPNLEYNIEEIQQPMMDILVPPPILQKDETLTAEEAFPTELVSYERPRSMTSDSNLNLNLNSNLNSISKGSTIGSRRIDSLRFKEKIRGGQTASMDKLYTRLKTSTPTQQLTSEKIDSEIERMFEDILISQ